MASTTQIHSLTFLTCLLTVAASGDDFSLSGLVFGPTSFAAETLPLDDPNSDFTRTNESVFPHQVGKLRWRGVSPAALCTTNTSSPLADCCTPLMIGHAVTSRFPRAELNTRLRC